MYLDIYFYIGLTALILSSITDLKRREVPDWINFGLIFFGILFSLIISIQTQSIFPFINSILGVLIAFIIAAFMFYTGQWGGGDAKMLMGLGALFGISLSLKEAFNGIFTNLVFNIIIAGAIYGILWSVYLSILNWRKLIVQMKELSSRKIYSFMKKIIFFLSAIVLILAIISFKLRVSLATLAVIFISTYYIFIYIKAIEEVCMIKMIDPEKLTEGDWIVDKFSIGGKSFIKKDKVISESDLKKIRKHQQKTDMLVNIRRKIFYIPFNTSRKLSQIKEKDQVLDDIKKFSLKSKSVLKKEDVDLIKIYLRKNSLHYATVMRKTFMIDKKIEVPAYDLRLNDKLMEELKSDEYLICSNKDLGIEKYQIEEVKRLYSDKKIEKIKIKEGIPFIPSFLLAYLMTFFMPSILASVIDFMLI